MFDPFEMGSEFFEGLTAMDEAIVAHAAVEPCRDCGGPLYRGDYPRKPRGGRLAGAAEAFTRRFSLCCGRDGCRRRATPPSFRFLGRRVYVGAVVIVTAAIAFTAITVRAAIEATGVPAVTTRRWSRWWRGPFTMTRPFIELSARMVPGPDPRRLPIALLERLAGDPAEAVVELLTWLAPLTTTRTYGSHWVRAAV